ncbi:MAG TPA: SAM-dependent methyltransferase, partial [Bradyrhizobium sp.]|nr:SAM-dependent methyltransferase [Bradyrhizobium sp.]
LAPPRPSRMEASRMEALRDLWTDVGLEAIETREIVVQRTFSDFDEFWTINLKAPSIAPIVAAMKSAEIKLLQTRVRARLPEANGGGVVCQGRAHAIRGRRAK